MTLIEKLKEEKVLNESLNLYQAYVLISVNKDIDRADVFNAMRAIPNVVIVKPKDSDYLNSKETDSIGYSYVNIKFISNHNAILDFKEIKKIALAGNDEAYKVEGLISIKFKPSQITRV